MARTYARAKRIHLIIDNYGIHSATLTQRTLNELRRRRGRIIVHFLPPYCPDANRIEHVRQDLHANVARNHRCPTRQQLPSTRPDNICSAPGDG